MNPSTSQSCATLSQHSPAGGRLVATDGRTLPLRESHLEVDAAGGLARTVLVQRFANPWSEPLTVTYALPLPHDAVVADFAFRAGGQRVTGEVDRRETAKARFERAILEGRSAALLEQERGSLFTQQIGSIPPGEDLVAEITVDAFLAWLDEGAWEYRFPTVVAPRYLGGEGTVADADRVTQSVAAAGEGPVLSVELAIRDPLLAKGGPTSPSHSVSVSNQAGHWQVSFDPRDPVRLDRDVVVRWAVAGAAPGVTVNVARPAATHAASGSAFGLLTVTPPSAPAQTSVMSRDLVLLLDSSGSMNGEPFAQAKRLANALIESLEDTDTLEVVAFSSAVTRWRESPAPAGSASRRDAVHWVNSLMARGGTEMVRGVLESLRTHRPHAQRQVVLITDGLVGFESEVVRAIHDSVSDGSRLHCVGVGPAVNRSLLAPCARAGRGTETVIGLHEPVDPAAARLVRGLARPLVVNLRLSGSALDGYHPASLPDLYARQPVRIATQLHAGGGDLVIAGDSADGPWEARLSVHGCRPETGLQAAVKLYAREKVEDMDLALAAGKVDGPVDEAIAQVGLTFQIATRLTSWIAIMEEPGVDSREPIRRVIQPQRLPAGLSAEGLGLRAPISLIASHGFVEGVHDPDEWERSARIDSVRLHRSDRIIEPARIRSFAHSPHLSEPAHVWTLARLVHRDGNMFVFELAVTEQDLDWHVPQRLDLLWSEGPPRRAEVVLERTTREGRVTTGSRVRLAVTAEGELCPEPPDSLVIVSASGAVQMIAVEC